MRILLVDNYDSFTFNLVHAVEPLVDELVVCRNDEINIKDVALFDKIIFSPGPSLPDEAGDMMTIIKQYYLYKPMLGVCLGFQAIVEFFDGNLVNMLPVRHGESKEVFVNTQNDLFNGVHEKEEVGLYHSWGIRKENLPSDLESIAFDEAGVVMAIKHKELPLFGVQFHPESIMTPNGNRILENWINN
jgi:anthranilate synthase component 2